MASHQNQTMTSLAKGNSLFNSAMKGQWSEVEETYKNSSIEEKKAKITKAGDTALHVAVSYSLTETVRSMVKAIGEDEAGSILSIKNERGNTALHLAAQLGDLRMCKSMVEKHGGLVSICNMENETPIFCAARHGKMSVFLFLSKQGKDDVSLCRKKLGDTILHAAISGEYLDLALKITHYYPKLINSVNENGQTPLHILASKPNLFKSSYRFRLLDYLIYPCIIVDHLSSAVHNHEDSAQMSKNEETQNYPQNYNTCMNFFKAMRNLLKILSTTGKKEKPKVGDQENPQAKIDSYQGLLPPNYEVIILYIKLMVKALLIVLGIGISRMQKLTEVKRRHSSAIHLMDKLVQGASSYEYSENGQQPQEYDPEARDSLDRINSATNQAKEDQDGQDENSAQDSEMVVAAKIGVTAMVRKILKTYPEAVQELAFADGNKKEAKVKEDTAFLIAAKKGVVELVEKILDVFPVAIEDLDCNEKNVVLLAVENRQPCVYNLLLDMKIMKEAAFRQVDVHGNSALHLAAMAGGHRPWLIPGAALQMQWELKWFKFVKNSMPPHTFAIYNNKWQTPQEVFKDTHQDLIAKGTEWLTKTSESFSVVAALIATVAFSTSANIPGGVKEDSGAPNLKNQPAFTVFSISSIIALCFSVTALVFFLAILTSRFQEKNFARDLPRKLLVGLTALFTSVASILVSFCAGHFYLLGDHVRSAAYPIYAVTCFPVTFFVLAQLPLYFDLIVAIVNKVPQPSHQDSPC